MKHRAICVSLVLLSALGTLNADEAKVGRDEERRPEGVITRLLHLMPPACADQLDLTDEQRQSIKQLEAEFQPKRRQALLKAAAQTMAILEPIVNERDKREAAPVLAIMHEITGGLLEARRIRADFEKKMLAVLNEEQRRQYQDFKEHGHVRHRDADSLFPNAERKLQLTDTQKKQIAELRQDWDVKLRGILTPEQLKKYDRLKLKGHERTKSQNELD